MRCLYCGQELALLKRLTGGAEFCSEAHRTQYREEFNNLALSRLLQSQPAAATGPAVEGGARTSMAVAPPAQPASAEDPVAAGYLLEVPSPASAAPFTRLTPEPRDFSRHTRPALPHLAEHSRLCAPCTAIGVPFAVSCDPLDPPATARIWPGPTREMLPDPEPQLGEWAQLDFPPVGWSGAPARGQAPGPMQPPRPVQAPFPVELVLATAPSAEILPAPAGALPPGEEPALPEAGALPLRPVMVARRLGAPAATGEGAPAPTGKRRPDVRVIPTAPLAPGLAARAQRPASAPVVTARSVQPEPPALPPNRPPEWKPAPAALGELHLPELHVVEVDRSAWARMPVAIRAGVGVLVALVIVGAAYYAMNSTPAAATPAAPRSAYVEGRQINTAGWIEDWAPADPLRRVTLLRGSETFSDYRMEFQAQIQRKAIGWMFRGLNPRNFYVAKIMRVSRPEGPAAALVRYAVIDGRNEAPVETPLDLPWRVDTLYKVRFEAIGPRFAVWVQGKKVDEWRDARLGSGGLGLYAEGDEVAAVQGAVNVVELVAGQ
jgi:hypothetical protein